MSSANFWNTCKVNLLPTIDDELLDKMSRQIKPIMRHGERFRLVDTSKVDKRDTAYNWSPKLGRLVRLYLGALNSVDIITFHTWGYYGFFKPSLAETFACINQYVPDWSGVRFFFHDTGGRGDGMSPREHIIGNYHWCRCILFGAEQENVHDDQWERDCLSVGTSGD